MSFKAYLKIKWQRCLWDSQSISILSQSSLTALCSVCIEISVLRDYQKLMQSKCRDQAMNTAEFLSYVLQKILELFSLLVSVKHWYLFTWCTCTHHFCKNRQPFSSTSKGGHIYKRSHSGRDSSHVHPQGPVHPQFSPHSIQGSQRQNSPLAFTHG